MNAEIEDHIRKKITWTQVPTHLKQILRNSQKDYEKHIISFSIKNQLRYRGNLVRDVFRNEKRYYERVVAYSTEKLMLFPYHLADMVVKGLRITPFNYYSNVIERLIQAEKSYDTLPNFTAADCLRLLGIGRNEYIDIMNKSRSNRGRLFGKKNVKILLPSVPCDIHIEPWWRVEIGLVLEEDIKMVNEEELASQSAGELNYSVVLSLYKKGLLYLDVPITAVDCVQVPPLQGFVMNRVTGDYFETLLYKIFVSIDEHISVGELAVSVLQVDTELVKQAVSLYCRLQFARKLNPETELEISKRDPSWNQTHKNLLGKQIDITPLTLHFTNAQNDELLTPQIDYPESPASATLERKGKRVAFLFDSTLTAFLMMGNLSHGLKKHAVTMFEVGKLCDESLDSFLTELEKVSALDAEGEGEARRFFDHAVILRSTVLSLRKLSGPGLDLVRLESLHSLDEATCLRLLQKKYKLLVSMAPLCKDVRPVTTLSPPHLGPAVPEVNTLWFKLFLYHMTGYGPPSLLLVKGTKLKGLPRMFLGYSQLLVTTWLHEPVVIPISSVHHVSYNLEYSPVLIQAFGVHQTTQVSIVPFPFRPDTPSKSSFSDPSVVSEFSSHPAVKLLSSGILDMEHGCGYLTMANIGVLDFGCPNRDPVVRLGKNRKVNSGFPKKSKTENNNTSLPTSLTNENFCFINKPSETKPTLPTSPLKYDEDCDLHTPNESHFANTPVTNSSASSSPANGFTNQESSNLLIQELDQLELEAQEAREAQESIETHDMSVSSIELLASPSLEGLMSPMDENINLFTSKVGLGKDFRDGDRISGSPAKDENGGEVWTLLDCHFGVPLFDVNANTKICDTIISGGLAETESLNLLVESSRNLGSQLLDFISHCQYYPDENMELMKRGRLVPQPRYNLVFDNGKVSEWLGK